MKSKFKNNNCEYWKLKRKVLLFRILQLAVMVLLPFILFVSKEDWHSFITTSSVAALFIFMKLERIYSAKMGERG